MHDDSIEMVMGNYKRIFDNKDPQFSNKLMRECENLSGNDVIRNYYFGKKKINSFAWNKLIKKDFLRRFGISFKEGIIWEDNLWIFYVMKHLNHLHIIGDVTYLYYMNPFSISTGTDLKDRRMYWGMVYSEITNNFTSGDSNREAKFYVRKFCMRYCDCPQDIMYRKSAWIFRRELSLKNDPVDFLMLITIGTLANTWIERQILRVARKIYNLIN